MYSYLCEDLELSPQKDYYIGSSICMYFLMVTKTLQTDDYDIVLQDVIFSSHGYLYITLKKLGLYNVKHVFIKSNKKVRIFYL